MDKGKGGARAGMFHFKVVGGSAKRENTHRVSEREGRTRGKKHFVIRIEKREEGKEEEQKVRQKEKKR